MKFTFKKTLTVILSLIILSTAAAQSSFAGFAGVSVDVQPAEDATPEVYAKGVAAGQYTLSETLSFKGNFQFATGDIASNGLFQETPSLFSIRELSGTYTYFAEESLMQFSVLLGDQNSFGSDQFVRNTLGVRRFVPSLLISEITPVSAGMHGFSGIGLSFIDDFGPNALGVYCFYDRDTENDYPQLNTDLQYAFEAGSSLFDTNAGFTLPVESMTDTGEQVFILIRKVVLRGGISSLFTISDRMQLFVQAGISGIVIPDMTPIGLENVFFFAEPRITLPGLDMNISFFCLTDASLRNLSLISKPLGCNINFQTLSFPLFSHSASVGLNAAACSERSPAPDSLDVVIAPYMNYSLFTGNFNTAVVIHPMSYDNVSEFFKLTLSYKAQF